MHTVQQIISVVTVRTADYTATVALADGSEMLRVGASPSDPKLVASALGDWG